MPSSITAQATTIPALKTPWPSPRGMMAGPSRAVAWEVAKLLAIADSALDDSDKVARAYIARAATLLLTPPIVIDPSVVPEADPLPVPAPVLAAEPVVSLAPWQLKRVVSFVEDHLADPIKVGGLAAVAKLGASHFSRAFKGSVGRTPHTYLMERRIERAKVLMLDTDHPLSQIALDCGMSDQAHLSRLFRRFVGVGPMAWRRARKTAATVRPAAPRQAGAQA